MAIWFAWCLAEEIEHGDIAESDCCLLIGGGVF